MVGTGRSSVADICDISRANCTDGVTSTAFHYLKSMGAGGTYLSNQERDLHTWLKGLHETHFLNHSWFPFLWMFLGKHSNFNLILNVSWRLFFWTSKSRTLVDLCPIVSPIMVLLDWSHPSNLPGSWQSHAWSGRCAHAFASQDFGCIVEGWIFAGRVFTLNVSFRECIILEKWLFDGWKQIRLFPSTWWLVMNPGKKNFNKSKYTPKIKIDTQHDGLEKVTPFKYGHFLVSLLNFWGVRPWKRWTGSDGVDSFGGRHLGSSRIQGSLRGNRRIWKHFSNLFWCFSDLCDLCVFLKLVFLCHFDKFKNTPNLVGKSCTILAKKNAIEKRCSGTVPLIKLALPPEQ